MSTLWTIWKEEQGKCDLRLGLHVSLSLCLQTAGIVLHKDVGIDRTGLIIRSVCFSSLKTSILGYSRLLKASPLSFSSSSHLFCLSSFSWTLSRPSYLFLPSFSVFLLLQCKPGPCLIDGGTMKVARGGMVVPCFLLHQWRRLKSCLCLPSAPRTSSLFFPNLPVILMPSQIFPSSSHLISYVFEKGQYRSNIHRQHNRGVKPSNTSLEAAATPTLMNGETLICPQNVFKGNILWKALQDHWQKKSSYLRTKSGYQSS